MCGIGLRRQGHSKNPTGHGRYCLGAVFAEVFASDGYRAAETANDADGSIAKRGERTRAGPDATAVLVHADVSDVMEFVFDGPMGADERQQTLWPSISWREAGDQIDDLDTFLVPNPARAFEPRDLAKARPVEMRHGFGAGRNRTRFDAAVVFVECPSCAQIRRRTVVAPLGAGGGKDRRTPRRCQLSAQVGCL